MMAAPFLSSTQTQVLLEECWEQLFRLHRSLAELKRVNAQGRELLHQAFQTPPVSSSTRSARIDPETWRKRAEEARTLVNITANAESKRTLLQIADTYDALAFSQESST
jgi:hypothetical protein